MPNNSRLWTEKEKEALKKLYAANYSAQDIAKRLNRTLWAVQAKICKERAIKTRPWTEQDLELLRMLYPNLRYSIADIAKRLNRTETAISAKAFEKKLNRNLVKQWSQAETDYLLETIGNHIFEEAIKKYNSWASRNGYSVRTRNQIVVKLKKEKVSRRLQFGSDWLDTAAIAAILGGNQKNISDWWSKYEKELKPKSIGNRRKAIHRKDFAKFLINHPDILDRYRHRFDALLLMDLFRS